MTNKNEPCTYRFPTITCTLPDAGDAAHLDGSESLAQKVREAERLAFEEAFAQGRDASLKDEQEKVRPLHDVLTRTDLAVRAHRQQIPDQCQHDAVRLALALAKDLIDYELTHRSEPYDGILRAAIERVAGQEQIKIRGNPADRKTIDTILADLFPDAGRLDKFQISADPSIQAGGCLIETDFGVVDARIEGQLDAVRERLAVADNQTYGDPAGEIDEEEWLAHLTHRVESGAIIKSYGHVTQVVGLVVEANGPMVQLGTICDIYGNDGTRPVAAEVLGFRDKTVLMMPLAEIRSIGPGSRVVAREGKASVSVGANLFGRVIDGLGHPIDGQGPLGTRIDYPLYANPINPL
ncbi:MAG: hypothetical protein HKP58_09760, partial [Desulfatitalea sp.]|nr:hypothetical protein [Desulfatitalea sp.]NNK00687.1 hypothetical protein [Desulfatitalea sp.]